MYFSIKYDVLCDLINFEIKTQPIRGQTKIIMNLVKGYTGPHEIIRWSK